jgi:cell division protein FtsL
MPAALKTPFLETDLAPDNSAPAPDSNAARATPRRSTPATTGTTAQSSARRIATQGRVPSRAAEPAGEEASRRKSSRREAQHRQFRPSLTAMLCGCALMGQLVLLLWLHGNTLTAAREVEKVDAQIAETSNDIERVQERVAAFDSSPQVKQWAAEKGWKLATPHDFDDTTQIEQARAMAQAAAAQSNSQGEQGSEETP